MPQLRVYALATILTLSLFAHPGLAKDLAPIPGGELWITTDYSKVILRERGTLRTLYFVRDSGEQLVESAMDMSAPHRLLLGYTQSMFASYLFVPEPKQVLIVGLGAGSMVRFLGHYESSLEIVAVDIDPMMLQIADKYFGTRPSENVHLVVADGVEYIQTTHREFDVIYMDAFLKPSDVTDSTGVPLAMKTSVFYQRVQDRLIDGGAVVFNVNLHEGIARDIDAIRKSFASAHLFRVGGTGNVVVVATKRKSPVNPKQLRETAQQVDKRFSGDFFVEALLSDLVPGR